MKQNVIASLLFTPSMIINALHQKNIYNQARTLLATDEFTRLRGRLPRPRTVEIQGTEGEVVWWCRHLGFRKAFTQSRVLLHTHAILPSIDRILAAPCFYRRYLHLYLCLPMHHSYMRHLLVYAFAYTRNRRSGPALAATHGRSRAP